MAHLDILIYLSQLEASVVLPYLLESLNPILSETFIKAACIHKHIAALNNAIHHVEHPAHYSYPNMTIMQLIIAFNGDHNHSLHYTLLLVLAARKPRKLKAEWRIDVCKNSFTQYIKKEMKCLMLYTT